MFDRAGLKTAAKTRVLQNRWMAVLICLVAAFCGAIGGNGGGITLNLGNFDPDPTIHSSSPSFGTQIFDFDYLPILIFIAVVALITMLVAFAFQFFVANIIHVGFCGWFLRYSRGENPDFGEMFSRFNHFKTTMLGMLLRDVYIFLWTLLLIIPGIIKSFSYAMVPYILYENPTMPASQALRISEAMMDGWKWELFKFELSFIGWYILTPLTCGLLGLFFVNPYYYTAHAMLFDNIKYDAVYTRGVVNASMLNMPLYPYEPETEVIE